MRLTNRLTTQTSLGYNSFIGLFKYKLLLAILMLLGVAINADSTPAPIFVDKNTASGATKTNTEVSIAGATATTQRYVLQDAIVSGLDNNVIGNDSILYIGVTQTGGKIYTLDHYTATFEIDVTDKSTLIGKPSITKLKSIEVYTKLAKGLTFSSSNTGGNLELTKGLNIHKGAEVAGLMIDGASLTFKGAVSNHGHIIGAVTVTGAKFTKDNIFTLINETDGLIDGKITGKLSGTGGAQAGKFNLINNGKINITATSKDIDIDNYSGSGRITVSGISSAIASGSEPIQVAKAYFSDGGQLVLKASAGFTKANLHIVKATTITGFTKDQLLCQLNVYKNTGCIITGSASITTTSIAVQNATATVLTDKQTIELFPKHPIQLNKVTAILANTNKKVGVLSKVSATEFAGIKLNDVFNIIETSLTGTLLDTVLDDAAAEDYPDLLMPDSSNSTLNASSKVSTKVFDHIGNRIASKNINFSATKGLTAVNSGDVADNLSIWSSVGYAGSNQKKTKDNQDFSKLSGVVVNIGLDTNLNKDMVIGACYGFSNNKVTIHGAHNKTKKAENKIMSHVISGYGAINFNHSIDANFAIMIGLNQNDYKEVGGATNNDKYNSIMFGLNTGIVYPIDMRQYSIDILAQLGCVHVSSKQHDNKYGKKTPEQSNTLVNLGFGSEFRDTTILAKNMPLHYKLGLMMKVAITTGDEHSVIVFDKAKNITLKVKNRKADMFSINCNTGFDLQAKKNLDINFDFDIGASFAPMTISYGVGLGMRHKF